MELQPTFGSAGQLLVQVLYAILILVVGWLVAKGVAWLVRKLLHWVRVDERIGKAGGGTEAPHVEELVTKAVYYLILLFVVVAALQALGLTMVTEPLNLMLGAIFAYIPRLILGGVVIFIAWLVAKILRAITRGFLEATKLDKRVRDASDLQAWPLARAVGEAVYWLVWLLFLPVILAALGLEGLLVPVMDLLNQLLRWIPNLIIAALILIIGWLVARIVRRVVANFFAAIGADNVAERIGLAKYMGKMKLSALIGLVVFALILIPIIVAALEALQLAALTAPLVAMLTAVLVAIPIIIVAAIVIAVAFFVGRWVGGFVAQLLAGLGFDNVLFRLGLAKDGSASTRSPSKVVGWLVTVGIVLGATLAAFTMLRLDSLATLLSDFIVFAWQVILGLLIFGIGLWIATWTYNFVVASNWPRKFLLAVAVRIAIILLTLAMALTTMGLADSIILLAFALPLAGVALAIGLAFGLGGREAAAKQLDQWQIQMTEVDSQLAAQAPEKPEAGD